MRIDILTIFPEMFTGVLSNSILKIAHEKGLVEYNLVDIREFTTNKHKKIDDRPFGGGPGMVMMADPIIRAVESLSVNKDEDFRIILLSPQGKKYSQELTRHYSAFDRLILICGHYEGFDERVRQILQPDEVSIGDYVLTGGEIPAMVMIDSVVRLLPGILGSSESHENDSFENDLLEHPHYTRPRVYDGIEVPEVLLSGDHAKIKAWRERQSIIRTLKRRPDLLKEK